MISATSLSPDTSHITTNKKNNVSREKTLNIDTKYEAKILLTLRQIKLYFIRQTPTYLLNLDTPDIPTVSWIFLFFFMNV